MSDKMTISQALRRIKKLKGIIAENTQRASQSVSYTQDKVPAFRFEDCRFLMQESTSEMIMLESRVAVANAANTITAKGVIMPLCTAIRLLQELKGQIAFLKSLHLRSEVVKSRELDWDESLEKNVYRTVETVFVSDLSEKERDEKIKSLQDEFENLNNAVENANHTIVV